MGVLRCSFYLFPPALPAAVLGFAAAALALAWLAVHRFSRRALGGTPAWLRAAVRVAVGWAALLTLFQALAWLLVYTAALPAWVVALAGAIAVETVLGLYGAERRMLPRRTGRTLLFLRAMIVLSLALLLLRPVVRVTRRWNLRRRVIVLLDDSASMQTPDNRMSVTERLHLAARLVPGCPRVSNAPRIAAGIFARLAVRLGRCAREAQAAAPGIHSTGKSAADRDQAGTSLDRNELTRERKELENALSELRKLAENLPPAAAESRAAVLNFTAAVRTKAIRPLETLARSPGGKDRAARAAELLRISAFLGTLPERLAVLDAWVNRAIWKALPPEVRRAAARLAEVPRLTLAAAVLEGGFTRPSENGVPRPGSLLARLASRYDLQLMRFAGRPGKLDAGALRRLAQLPLRSQPAAGPADRLRTDLSAALARAARGIEPQRLAGILVLSDGRHNAPASLGPPLHQLASMHVPVSSLLFGDPNHPPTDAAIRRARAPQTVYTGDTLAVTVDLAVSGCAGKTLQLRLEDSGRLVHEMPVTVKTDSFLRRLVLTAPCAAAGLHRFTVRFETPPGDVCPGNNLVELPVRVRSDPVGLLLIDDRARWEYRYLKNLFAGRDPMVRCQAVLLHPDRIAGITPPPPVPAALERAATHPEADLPPANPAEWLKFDVVILGDVSPGDLGKPAVAALRAFVERRGGALILVAGPRAMPHAWRATPLAAMLPVEPLALPPGTALKQGLPSPEPAWRWRLTPAGKQHPITRLAADPAENLRIWAGLPVFYWRHPALRARPQATVLAWAAPAAPFGNGAASAPIRLPESPRARRAWIARRAVLALQRFGLGSVLLVATDETWRFRYLRGDALHHRFWGQVLRWAARDKLPDGTATVRIGTDRGRYSQGEKIRLRVRIARPDYTPVRNARPTACLLRNGTLLGRYALTYVPDSPGVYSVVLPPLAPGRYAARLELPPGTPGADLLAAGKPPPSTQFSIVRPMARELAELTPDRDTLEHLAAVTGGRVADPGFPEAAVAPFHPPVWRRREVRDWSLWNAWPCFGTILLLFCTEWYLRKRRHLP